MGSYMFNFTGRSMFKDNITFSGNVWFSCSFSARNTLSCTNIGITILVYIINCSCKPILTLIDLSNSCTKNSSTSTSTSTNSQQIIFGRSIENFGLDR